MTQKQRDYISFIEEMTGVQFKEGDNVSDYINANADLARNKWELECYAQNCTHECAGDRD